MERQSTSKLYRALIAVVAFFVLCTSAILFASCGTDPRECKHEHLADSDVVAVELATCGTPGTVTYECSDCGAEVTQIGTLATGEHTWANGKCTTCGMAEGAQGLTLKQVQDALATLTTKVDEQASVFVKALKDPDVTIPALDKKLQTILESVQDFGDLDIEGFDASEFDFLADSGTTGKVTLTDVITALYKQVHQLYVDYASTAKDANLYDLLVSTDGSHVHNWILKLKDEATKDCSKPASYVWGCAFCDAVKDDKSFTIQAVGHATDYKYGLNADNTPTKEAVDGNHYIAATCISPARVEGYCANCENWTGEWNPVGQPTYKHNYVLEETHGKDSCTHVHENVYHCATCGGAYVEESEPDGHQYYYKLDENGKKVALKEEEKNQLLKDYYGEDQDLSALSEEEKGLALQPYLNVVYSSDATCVDPGLVVVECVECGVRYSYTTGEAPTGHSIVAGAQIDNTCIKDGVAGYAYCYKCGYFFFFDADVADVYLTKPGTNKALTDTEEYPHDGWYVNKESNKDEVTTAFINAIGGLYSRNYIRKDGKVLHYVLPEDVVKKYNVKQYLPEAKAQDEGKTVDPTLAALYEATSEKLPAKGHTFVPVYTNTARCVTAQSYVLVCKDCFKYENGNLVATNTAFKQVTEDDEPINAYSLAVLTGQNLKDLAANGVVETALNKIVASKTWDDTTNEDDEVVESNITEDWNEAVEGGKTALVNFFVAHQGYLVRDVHDDEQFTLGDTDEKKAALKTELEKLDETALKALYSDYNVVVMVDEDAEVEEDDETPYIAKPFTDPVAGHKFVQKFVTVIGSCVMYERHVFFCSVCGQNAGTPKDSEAPYTIDKARTDDVYAEDAKYNDLYKAWEALLASLPANGGGFMDVDDAETTVNWSMMNSMNYIVPWLLKYGYLNDFRDGDLTKAANEDELSRVGNRVGDVYFAAYEEAVADEKDTFDPAKFEEEFWSAFFTQKNVLGEYKVTLEWGTETLDYGDDDVMVVEDDTEIELGHKFDTIAYIGDGETCDAPASYVYVCSECGLKSDVKPQDFSFTNGKGTAKVPGVKSVAPEATNYATDASSVAASVPTGMDATGKPYAKSDLELEYNAAVEAGTDFDWLLEKGYLNTVIDSVMLFGYTNDDDEHVKGELEKAIEANLKLPADEQKTLKQLFADTQNNVTSGLYYTFYEVTETKVGEGSSAKTIVTRTFIGDKEAIKAAAEEIALAVGYVKSSAPDLAKFYTQSGDGQDKNGTDLNTDGKAANKTSNDVATTIPMSGHLWADKDGKAIDVDPETGDPLCMDFASDKLKEILNPTGNDHYYAVWYEKTDTAAAHWGYEKSDPEGAEPTKDSLTNAKKIPEQEWAKAKDFIQNAKDFGVIAACRRGASCPLHKAGSEITETSAFGFYAASNHVTSYEKFSAISKDAPYPSGSVETEKVYYNYKEEKDYVSKDLAGKFLTGSDTWDAVWTLANTSTEGKSDTEKKSIEAANEKIDAAAKAAMDADLENIATLQKIWNSLFVDVNWLYPKATDENSTTVIDWEKSDVRTAKYPVYEDVMTGKSTETTTKKVDDKDVKEEHVYYTGVDFEAVVDLFADGTDLVAGGKIPELWTEDAYGDRVSAWRPLSDNIAEDGRNMPSCWLSLRCKWYHAKGNLCTSGYPDVVHTLPNVPAGEEWYGAAEFDANCQHKQRCMTCGLEYGAQTANHKLVNVKELSNDHNKEAWLTILNEAKKLADTATTPAFLVAVKAAVWFKDDVDTVTLGNYDEAWGVREACYDGTNYEVSICTGQLEMIYKNIKSEAATWDYDGTTTDKKIAWSSTGDNPNYKVVKDTDTGSSVTHAKHGWEIDGAVEGEDYETRFFYLANYKISEGVIAEAGERIYVDKTTRAFVKVAKNAEAPATAEPATEDEIKFSSIVCEAGYSAQKFCLHEVQHAASYTYGPTGSTTTVTLKKGDTCNHPDTADEHEAAHHTFAAIKDYWTYDKFYKKPVTEGNKANATVAQVCTSCGMFQQGEWALNAITAENRGGSYNLASGDDIEAWNAYAEAWNAAHDSEHQVYLAQMIKTEDVVKTSSLMTSGDTPAQKLVKDLDGLYVLKGEGAEKKITFTLSATELNNTIGEGKDVTFLVGAGSTLKFEHNGTVTGTTDADNAKKRLVVNGTLAIVGETNERGEKSKVDFSDLYEVRVEGGQLILKDIEVDFGDKSRIYPASGGTITLDGATVTSLTPFIMSAHNGFTSSDKEAGKDDLIKIVIKNSVLKSNSDMAFAIWKDSVEVEAENSLFAGAWAGALVRRGTAKFTNCWFATIATSKYDASSKGNKWQDGSNIPVSAGIIIGNAPKAQQGLADFGQFGGADVTLRGCDFYTYESSELADLVSNFENAQNGVATTSVGKSGFTLSTDNVCYTIAAYSSEETKTTVKIDTATSTNMGTTTEFHDELVSGKTSTDPKVHQLTYTIEETTAAELGETPEKQAAAAATLVKNALASGGDIALPQIKDKDGKLVPIDYTTAATNPLTVPEGKSASVDLGDNVVNVKTGSDANSPNRVEGDLTITNGTINGNVEGNESKSVDFAVQAGGSLTLRDVTANFSTGGGIGVAGAEAKGDDGKVITPAGKIVIESSTLIGVQQVVVTNNAETTNADITITNSQILAKGNENAYATALLINAEGVKLTAKGSTFYGLSNAVWVRAGDATFDNCEFVSGGWRTASTGWTQGTGIKKEAVATLVVGDSDETTSYGSANVRITGSDSKIVRGWVKGSDERYAGTTDTVTFNTDGTLHNAEEATANALSKRMVVASATVGEGDEAKVDKTTVVFGNKALAEVFTANVSVYEEQPVTIKGLEKDKNVFYPENKEGNVSVKYVTEPAVYEGDKLKTPEKTEPVDVVIPVDATGSDAETALKDAALSGGVVTLPETGIAEGVTLNERLYVKPNKSFEIQLNGNKLDFGSKSGIAAGAGADVVIEGGTIESSSTADEAYLISKSGEGNVTLRDVTVTGKGDYGFAITPKAESTQTDIEGSVWTIEDSVIISAQSKEGAWTGTGIWINGLVDGLEGKATMNITGSVIIGGETGLNVAGDVTVNAANSTFFGCAAAVQLNSGTSTFTNCTFIGGEANCDNKWSGGNSYPQALNAVFVAIAGKAATGKVSGYGTTITTELRNCSFVLAGSALNDTDNNGAKPIVAGSTVSGKYYTEATNTDNRKVVSLTSVANGVINFTVDATTAGRIGKLELNKHVFAYASTDTTVASTNVSLTTIKTLIKTTGIEITEQPKPEAETQP